MSWKRLWSMAVISTMLLYCCLGTASAVEVRGDNVPNLEILGGEAWEQDALEYWDFVESRASRPIQMSIPAHKVITVKQTISLDKNNIVTFNCTYSPKDADVEFGLISPTGVFFHTNGSNGKINTSVNITKRGSYTVAVRNNSSQTVTVDGTIRY